MSMKKVLVIRFSSIGDIVLTTPVVRQLAKQNLAEVHYLTKEQFRGLLAPNPYIARIHTFKESLSEVIPTLLAEGFDEIIDLHNNLRSLKVKRALKLPSYSFPKLNFEKWVLVNFKINLLPNVHIVERYLDTIAHLGAQDDGEGLDHFIPEDQIIARSALPATHQEGFIAFVIGGQHDGKMCSEQKIASICQQCEGPIALLGGPEDAAKGERIAAAVGPRVWNAAGKYKLHQSASILSQANVVITHDTGLMHIAAALKKRIVSLWGGTVPQLGMYPYRPGEGSIMLEVKHIMRPSSKLGSQKGIYRLWNFMDMIPNSLILEAIQGRTKT